MVEITAAPRRGLVTRDEGQAPSGRGVDRQALRTAPPTGRRTRGQTSPEPVWPMNPGLTPASRWRDDQRGWRVAPAPDGRGAPETAQEDAAASLARVHVVRGRAAGPQPGLGAAALTRRPAAGQGAVQPVFPVPGAVRPGGLDRVQGRHDPGHVQVAGALPADRHAGHADDAVRDPGPQLLEQQPADRPAQVGGCPGQRAVDDADHAAARLVAARLRADAADRRAVRPVRPPRRQGRWRHGCAGQLRPLQGAAGRPGDDQGHVRRRGGDRRGQVRADRDRRLPAQPRALRAARRADAPRGAALRRAGNGQDAAGARGRGRGARGVLLDLGLGVHRGDRRRRRLARP